MIAQPELHYVIGVTNWVFNLSKKVLGSNKYYKLVEWCQHHGITIHGYQGGGLDGNNSKKFLKYAKSLSELLPESVSPAVTDLLSKFDNVVSGCFSYYLSENYCLLLDQFKTSVWELISVWKQQFGTELSVPWKVHMVMCHVKPQLDSTGEGLAGDSEQTGESGHSKMKKEMARYKQDLTNTHHGERTLAGVKRFVSKRIH